MGSLVKDKDIKVAIIYHGTSKDEALQYLSGIYGNLSLEQIERDVDDYFLRLRTGAYRRFGEIEDSLIKEAFNYCGGAESEMVNYLKAFHGHRLSQKQIEDEVRKYLKKSGIASKEFQPLDKPSKIQPLDEPWDFTEIDEMPDIPQLDEMSGFTEFDETLESQPLDETSEIIDEVLMWDAFCTHNCKTVPDMVQHLRKNFDSEELQNKVEEFFNKKIIGDNAEHSGNCSEHESDWEKLSSEKSGDFSNNETSREHELKGSPEKQAKKRKQPLEL